jgi:hypothetical protein
MKAFVLACALALSFCAVTDAVGTVPFKATIETVVTAPVPCGGPLLCIADIGGTGRGSHFGLMQIEGPSQLNVATLVQTGISRLTAADGSTLLISIAGTFVLDATGAATFQGDWVAISGTGRFSGEGGSGTYHGSASGATGILFIEGELTNPGVK